MTSNADETTMSRRGLFRVGAAGAAAATGLAAGSGGVAAQYDGWLDDVDNYDGTHDYTGQDEVTVEVGAVDGGLKFGPAAILIDPGDDGRLGMDRRGRRPQCRRRRRDIQQRGPGQRGGNHLRVHLRRRVRRRHVQLPLCPHEAVGMKGVVAIGSVDDDS